MCVANAFRIPRPNCCIVKIRGVGDVCECPKNFRVLVRCQCIFAVWSIAAGHGDRVDR